MSLIGAAIAIVPIYQFGPAWLESVRTRDMTEEHRAELRAWVREAARDGVTSARERAALEQLVSSARLREYEVRAFLVETEESIEASADLVRQGAVLAVRGEFRQACDLFVRATSRDPENVQAWVNLGAAKLEMELPNEAESALRRALELKPDWAAHYNLGASLAASGSSESALGHLERSLELVKAADLSKEEKDTLRRDLVANRWLDSLRHLPRFEALLRHPALVTRGI